MREVATMINDETKRKLRELNMSEIISGLELISPSPLHGASTRTLSNLFTNRKKCDIINFQTQIFMNLRYSKCMFKVNSQ